MKPPRQLTRTEEQLWTRFDDSALRVVPTQRMQIEVAESDCPAKLGGKCATNDGKLCSYFYRVAYPNTVLCAHPAEVPLPLRVERPDSPAFGETLPDTSEVETTRLALEVNDFNSVDWTPPECPLLGRRQCVCPVQKPRYCDHFAGLYAGENVVCGYPAEVAKLAGRRGRR